MTRALRAFGVMLVVLFTLRGESRAETSAEQRIRLLEEQLRKTQRQLEELKAVVEQQKAIGQATQKQVQDAQEQAKTATAEATKKPLVDLPDWVRRTTLFGDLRARHEGFYHQPTKTGAAVTARNRERIRARVGVKVAFSDEISGTVRLATGNIDDPISTNQTLTGNFNRKSINLDWAYLTLAPGQTFGVRPGAVSINAGKFPNPIFRVGEMVFDDDLSPEGLGETFQLLDKPISALDQVKVHALQWVYNEITNKEDGWMFGGQVNPTMHFGSVQLEAGVGEYWWLNPDQIAQSLDKNVVDATTGVVSSNSRFNSVIAGSNSNLLRTVQPPTPKGGKKPAPVIVGYRSTFQQTQPSAAVTIPNVVLGQPVRLWGDYVKNWEGATDDDEGWQFGLRVGQVKVRNDWSIYGLYEHLEQEAAISAFTYSDFGFGGTNVEGPVVGLEYQLLNPLTLGVRSHFTHFINDPAGGTGEFPGKGFSNPTMTRIEFDALLKF